MPIRPPAGKIFYELNHALTNDPRTMGLGCDGSVLAEEG